MGNINSQIPPYRPGDKKIVKETKGLASSAETQAGGAAASAAQAAEAARQVKDFLVEKFGDSDGNKIFDAIEPSKDKIGKNLSFDTVKAAIESNHGTMGDKLKQDLAKLIPANKQPESKDDSNPYKSIEEAYEFQQRAYAQMAKDKDAHLERLDEAETKDIIRKQEEIKEEQQAKEQAKKGFNPKNYPEV